MKKLLLIFSSVVAGFGASGQNADPVVNIEANDNTILVGNTTQVNVEAGNFGADAIAAQSIQLTLTAGPATEITGVTGLGATKWILYSSTTGTQNTYTFRNASGFDADFDITAFSVTVLAHAVSAGDLIEAGVAYIPGPNPNLPGNPESSVQGNGAPDNDNSTTSVAVNPAIPLPLRLISFSARAQGCGAVFEWQAFDDVELSFYELQRRTGDNDYVTVARIASRRSPLVSSYSYLMNTVDAASPVYRLRMQKGSGETLYSQSVAVRPGCDEAQVRVGPNPATTVLQVSGVRSGTALRITNTLGQEVRALRATGNRVTIDVSALAPGTYFLVVGEERTVHPFVRASR